MIWCAVIIFTLSEKAKNVISIVVQGMRKNQGKIKVKPPSKQALLS